MTARRDLAAATEGAERELDAVFARLAVQVRHSVKNRTAGATMTQAARSAILADLDAFLATAYGRRHGERSAAWLAVTRWANAAALAPIDRAVADVRARLKDEPELLARTEAG